MIHAIATPPGVGGIGVVRVSGPAAAAVAEAVLGSVPAPRRATLSRFADASGETIDSGIALYFPAPASLTGEDVLELQGHGGPVVLQRLCQRIAALGSRQARPGEFLERAYLNDKIDLVQAEAVADLISSGTEAAARAARRSMDGAFSDRVTALQERLTRLRVFVEAALDFPEEEIDFLAESDVADRAERLLNDVRTLQQQAGQGRLLRDGVTVAIIGLPNAGKSSLLNALSGRESAIVTDLPGTTRDVLRESLSLDGLPVHIADTAGIRDSEDPVEAEGVRRARRALAEADLVLLVHDLTQPPSQTDLRREVPEGVACIEVFNKLDLDHEPSRVTGPDQVRVSALTGAGLDELVQAIRDAVGVSGGTEGAFSARTRHLDALRRVSDRLEQGMRRLRENAPEMLAEELRLAQGALGEITGEVLPDDLLGAIFASFCIGK